MEREEALNDFLKGLRMVFNNASAYPKEHPYFIKSVENFKQRVDTAFQFLNPIKINITPNSLFMDGRYWDKVAWHVEMAQQFHLRKVKGIEIREAVTAGELISFLSGLALPAKEILRSGGIQKILSRENISHIYIEGLDYSQLLGEEGEEVKDIWVYLFREAIETKNISQINEFADNFGKIIGKFKAKDLCEDKELKQNIYDFFQYLKNEEKDKFRACSKDLLRAFLRSRDTPSKESLDKVKDFFTSLDKDDCADTLLDAISKDEKFDYLSFSVFSRIIDEDKHKEIALALEGKIKNREFLKASPMIRKKIKELFSAPESSFVSPLYRHALSSLAEDNLSGENFYFDRDLLRMNYRLILLNLLTEEKDSGALSLISECLLKECHKIIAEKNLASLRLALELLDKKIKEDASLSSVLDGPLRCISDFIERIVFEDENIPGLDYFIGALRKSYLGFDFYLGKIFNEGRITPYALKLLLKFFPEKLPWICENLEKKHADLDFLAKFVKSLEGVDSALSIEILKRIFYFSNNIVKMEVLKSMQALSSCDSELLFSILKQEGDFLKREALAILAKNEVTRKSALETLLSVPSPWGKKNKILIENIRVIESMGLREAQDYLAALSRRRFFWNRNIREKAAAVLRDWHARED